MEGQLMTLSDAEFRSITTLVYERFGISLSDQKRTLVVGRLSKRTRELGLPSFGAYVDYIRRDHSGQELVEFINRISTNHTFFYREKDHFEFLAKKILPDLKLKLQRDRNYALRIWSAGCSSGEEPYTIAMTVMDALGAEVKALDWGILATDISTKALEEAVRASYPEARFKELPPIWKANYMSKLGPDSWTIKDTVRKPILFKRLNLMNETYPLKGQFDVIFCRNVMIYFDAPVRRALVDRFYRYVKPGGYFFVGHSESLPRDTCPFEYVSPAVYRKAATA